MALYELGSIYPLRSKRSRYELYPGDIGSRETLRGILGRAGLASNEIPAELKASGCIVTPLEGVMGDTL
jgi:hypothetical protein